MYAIIWVLSTFIMAKPLVVKDNILINACYSLNLVEQRLILLAIAKSKQEQLNISPINTLLIDVDEYSATFEIDKNSAYKVLKEGCKQLFRREFSYKNEKGGTVLSRWVSTIEYHDSNASISLIFAPKVIPFISELEKRFTSYFLKDVSTLNSAYAIRLYELVISWKSTHKTPIFEIAEFRNKLGVNPSEYNKMSNFKARVLNVAISQINENSNIKIECEQHKKGRKIVGFSFTFNEIKQPSEEEKDTQTIDWIDQGQSKSRKKITKQQAESMARVGESWQELLSRIGKDYHVLGV